MEEPFSFTYIKSVESNDPSILCASLFRYYYLKRVVICHCYENRQQEEQSHIHEVSIETVEFDVGFVIQITT